MPTASISSRPGQPAGAFDLEHVARDVDIRYADGTESLTPLSEPDTVENPMPGEIIYADTTGVLTRRWNHQDAQGGGPERGHPPQLLRKPIAEPRGGRVSWCSRWPRAAE